MFGPNIYQAKSGVISNSSDEECDEEIKNNFLVKSGVISNLRDQKWDEEKNFQSKHMSSQIWCYLKFERWRGEKKIGPNICQAKSDVISNLGDEELDEEMKNNFLVKSGVISNLRGEELRWRKKIFSPNICQTKSGVISNLRGEELRWRKIFLVQTYVKPNLVLSQILEMKSKMKRWRSEKKFRSKHTSSQVLCYLKFEGSKVRWRNENKK